MAVTTSDEAYDIYTKAQNSPQTLTCAFTRDHGVTIIGQMLFPGAQKAIFLRAFENGNAMVLKIPDDASATSKECLLYESVGADAKLQGIALVPVRNLPLEEGSSFTGTNSPPRSLRAGILMPNYSYSLQDMPKPITIEVATALFDRLSAAIDFLHDREWLHGDVKSANIFYKDDGCAYLGDYGSSVRYADLRRFTGGTPKYQRADVDHEKNPRLFDRMGLLLSLLEKLGKIELAGNQTSMGPQELEKAFSSMADDPLRNAMMAWM